MKAVLYGAKSTEDKHKSIPTQLEDGHKMAVRENWEVAGEFFDEAASAWSGDRGPELEAALQRAEDLAPCVLCVQHSDRLARGDGKKARHLGEIYFRAIKADVELRSVQDDSTFSNPLLAFAMGERNTEDSRRKSEAVKSGHQRRRAKGLTQGGKRRFGFKFVEGELAPIAAEVEVVDRILSGITEGRSYKVIARQLERAGVKTASGGKWHGATVRDIAINPIYVGKLRTKDGVICGAHDAVVDLTKWNQVQAILALRSKGNRGRGRPPINNRHLFYKGMLRCGRCGGSMSPRTIRPGASRPGRADQEVYICYTRSRDQDACSMMPIKRAMVDTAVFRYFEKVGLDIDATREQLAEARSTKLQDVERLLSGAEVERSKAENRLGRIKRDYQDGKLDAEDWLEHRSELTTELEAASAEVDRLQAQEVEVRAWSDVEGAERDTLEALKKLRERIAGEVGDAEGIEAVRNALSRLFVAFTITKPDQSKPIQADLFEDGYVIEPTIREQALAGLDSFRPIFKKVAIQAGNK